LCTSFVLLVSWQINDDDDDDDDDDDAYGNYEHPRFNNTTLNRPVLQLATITKG